MEWVFIAFLAASMIHMGEEYFYPGGFMDVMKQVNPKFTPLVTAPMAVVINGLQLLLCLAAIAVGKNAPTFSMSVAALLFVNGLVHIVGCFRVNRYVPGVITGTLIYIPLSAYAYQFSISSAQLTRNGFIVTMVLGLLYQAVPPVYLVVASALRRA